MKIILLLGCVLTAAFSLACSERRSIPDFARPAEAAGFVQLATGDAGEKEPVTFWLFGGSIPFGTWRDEAAATLTAMRWDVSFDPRDSSPGSEMLASSPDQKLCVGYYDLNASGNRFVDYSRETMKRLAPEALEASTKFSTVIYADAGRCP